MKNNNILCGAIVVCLTSPAAFALVPVPFEGTVVTGTLNFAGNANNYFDPANGFVPTGQGYINESSPTVTIEGPGGIFGFADAADVDTANLFGNELTIGDDDVGGDALPWTMTFTDTAFTGLNVSLNSDNFINGGLTASVTGDTITVSWAGDPVPDSDPQYTGTVDLISAPPVPCRTAWRRLDCWGWSLLGWQH